MKTKGCSQCETTIHVLLSSLPLHLNTMLRVYGGYNFLKFFLCGDPVFRRQNLTSKIRQILTSKDGPHNERINICYLRYNRCSLEAKLRCPCVKKLASGYEREVLHRFVNGLILFNWTKSTLC